MSKEDLIPLNKRSKQEQKEIARKGGKKSGEVRAEKKRMREWAEIFGAMKITVANADGSTTESDYDGAVVAALYRRAIQEHDVRAAEFLAKITGQLKEVVQLDADVSSEAKVMLSLGDIEPENLAKFITDAKKR